MIGIQMRPKLPGLLVLVALAVVVGSCVTDFGPPTATFDGESCGYDGLSEFHPGGTPTFTFNNRSDEGAGLGIVKVQDGISMDQLDADGVESFVEETVTAGEGTALSGESTSFDFQFSIEGDWLIYCFGDSYYPATIVEVSGPWESG